MSEDKSRLAKIFASSREARTGETARRRHVQVDLERYTYGRMGQSFTIREYRRSDFSQLWQIDQKCFPPGISYSQPELLFYMRRPRAFTLVAEPPGHDSSVAGFIVAESGRVGHIITIDVLQEFRRSGLGSQLIAAAEERLRTEGCRSVILETAVDNAAALSFYKRHQYFLAKTLPRYYATGVDAFVLKKDLLTEVPGG